MRPSRIVLLSTPMFALALGGCLQPKPAAVAKGGEAARVATPGAKKTAAPTGSPTELSAKDLSAPIKVKPGVWDQKGAKTISAAGAIIKLDAVSHKPRLALRFGNAHAYEMTLLNAGKEVGTLTLWTKKGVHRAQMIKRQVELPAEAVKAGYDSIKLVPRADDRYSIGGLELLD